MNETHSSQPPPPGEGMTPRDPIVMAADAAKAMCIERIQRAIEATKRLHAIPLTADECITILRSMTWDKFPIGEEPTPPQAPAIAERETGCNSTCDAAKDDGILCAEDECDRENGVRPASPQGDGVLYCFGGCGTRYVDFGRDVSLPTPLWNRIAVGEPFDETQENIEREGRGGVLCPFCIVTRLAVLPDCTVIFMHIDWEAERQLERIYAMLAKAHTAPVTCERHAEQTITGLIATNEVQQAEIARLKEQLANMDRAYDQALSRIEALNTPKGATR